LHRTVIVLANALKNRLPAYSNNEKKSNYK